MVIASFGLPARQSYSEATIASVTGRGAAPIYQASAYDYISH